MKLQQYKQEVTNELSSILDYWMQHAIDNINGGFVGKIDNENNIDYCAAKGAVLHARILWAFSSAYNFCGDEKYIAVATRSFHFVQKYFVDKEFGGVFWTVDFKGNMLDGKKQVYALAFCIYGLSEYYSATKNEEALALALNVYNEIEARSYDAVNKGYFEAFARDWKEIDDLRLSTKDANEKKTMNTHLHIIEAYANLYKVEKSENLRSKIVALLELFNAHFIDHKTFHLKLFFDEAWNEKPDVISYGHDIEAAWLLLQCAEIIEHELWIKIYKNHAVKIASAAVEGLDKDGGLWYEYGISDQTLIKEKHWWPQAEAMVGFMNVYELTGDEKYLEYSIDSWQFVKAYIKDTKNGEWFWGIKEDRHVMKNEDKVGLWKCPYHNSRACLEIIKRINNYL